MSEEKKDDRKQVACKVDEALYRKLKIHCATYDLTMGEILSQALSEYLEDGKDAE